MSFHPGDRVEAKFQGGDQWYAGTISRVTEDACDVAYDDGDREENVSVALIRRQATAAGTPQKRLTLQRQDSAEATSALLLSAKKIKEDALETSAETLANLRAAASESEAEASKNVRHVLRRTSSEVEEVERDRATKVLKEVAREEFGRTGATLKRAALDVSCDDAANTLRKVVAFQSDSEEDDVHEAPAPAPERFDGDSDDSRLEEHALAKREKRKQKTRFALERGAVELGDTERIRAVHDARTRYLRPRIGRRDLTDDNIAPPSLDARAVLAACFDGDLQALRKACKRCGFTEGLGLRCALVADSRGRTACHYAALQGRSEILKAFGEAWRRQASAEYESKVKELRAHLVEQARASRRREAQRELVDAYEHAAREADRELRHRELRCEAAWRACATARDDLGRTPVHYGVACVDPAHTMLVVRALLTSGAAFLDLPSNALVQNGALGTAPLAQAVAAELFADDTAAQRICERLFTGVSVVHKKRGWRYVGDPCRKHAKNRDAENRDPSAKARAECRKPVFLRIQDASRKQAAHLFPRHARVDVGTGALCGAVRSKTPLLCDEPPTNVDSSIKREALLLWLWRALRQGARRAARRYAEVGKIVEDGPGKTRTNAGELLRAFERADPKADGCVTLDQFDACLRNMDVKLAYGTLEDLAAQYAFTPPRNRPELTRDRRLKVDYERLIDDVLASQKDEEASLSEDSAASAPSHRSSDSERSDSDAGSTQGERLRRERAHQERRDARRMRVGAPAPAPTLMGASARTVAAATLKAVGDELCINEGSNTRSGTASARAWLRKSGAAWPAQSSYLAGFAELLKARSAVLDAHDCAGFTPLHCAAYVDAPTEACEALLRRGATRSLRSDDGALAEDLAKNSATRRSLRRMVLREFDLSFNRTHLEESDDDEEVRRRKPKGFSADRMPGAYHNYRNGDDRGVTRNKDRAARAVATLAAHALDAVDPDQNRRGGRPGAPGRHDAFDAWRTTPSSSKATDFNTQRPQLKRSTFFDACAFPLDRLVGDGRLRSPLHLAAEAGLHELVDALLAGDEVQHEGDLEPMGAPTFEIDGRDVDGWSPLMHACFRGGGARRKVARSLIDAGSNVAQKNVRGRTALHLASAHAREDTTVHKEDADIVELLLDESPGIIDLRDDEGATALYAACARGRVRSIVALLSRGADPWGRHVNTRCTALHAACATRSIGGADAARLLSQWCSGGDAHVNSYLLASTRVAHDDEIYGENDRDPQQTSRNRGTASNLDRAYEVVGFAPFSLDASSRKFRLDANERASPRDRKRLLACPLNCARDRRGEGARDAARSKGQREALDHVWDASLTGSLPRLRDALQREGAARAASSSGALMRPPWAFVSARDRTPRLGRTALHLVALGAARAVAAAQRRLRRDCAAGGKGSGRNLQAKAFEAADDQDHARCARCLLQRAGAAVDAEDASARTPLHYAAAAGASRVVAVLLEHGADVRICDEGGLTALHLAVAWGRTKVANQLRSAGASGGAKDHRGRTARDVAGLAARVEMYPDDVPAADAYKLCEGKEPEPSEEKKEDSPRRRTKPSRHSDSEYSDEFS